MFSRNIWLCWCTLVTVGLQSGAAPFQHQQTECTQSNTTLEVFQKCLALHNIVSTLNYECYKANTKGGCKEGERLVVAKNISCVTKCVANKDERGKPCQDDLIEYKGKCKQIGSESACRSAGLGKRLQADLHGEVKCTCEADLGYIDVDGECYHEHMQGPCEEGEQLLRNGKKGWKCVKNTCEKGGYQDYYICMEERC